MRLQPDRRFHYFRAPRSIDRLNLCYSDATIVKGLVGNSGRSTPKPKELFTTEIFANLEPQNPSIDRFYEVEKRRSTNSELYNCEMFGRGRNAGRRRAQLAVFWCGLTIFFSFSFGSRDFFHVLSFSSLSREIFFLINKVYILSGEVFFLFVFI